MHQSTLTSNDFGIILFGTNKNNIFLEFPADYIGVCLKAFQRREQILEIKFLAKFSTPSRTS